MRVKNRFENRYEIISMDLDNKKNHGEHELTKCIIHKYELRIVKRNYLIDCLMTCVLRLSKNTILLLHTSDTRSSDAFNYN